MPRHYPFTALVGSGELVRALVLAAVSPEIGGVLVRGEKGTAKTTAVRALTAVLPPIDILAGDPFSTDPHDPAPLAPNWPLATDVAVETRPVRLVELPVGATEDRVLGSLHLQRVLAEGVTQFEPGLLARAHRGILYVDEVNLLHDHLVDVLLDAAATGRVTVERDGVSVEHAARFVLIGTMNPEEGELRPQLLDRFGMTVEVAAPRDPELRAEVVRRRLAFDADPAAFTAGYADAETRMRARVVAARELVPRVELDAASLRRIADVCAAFEVDGMRADIVTARAAAANAAWQGRTRIAAEDLKVAARLALPHRRRRNPFDAPGIDEDLLDQLLDDQEPDPDPDGIPPDGRGDPDGDPSPAEAPATSHETAEQMQAPIPTALAGKPYRARMFTVPGVGSGYAGRRSRAVTDTGRRVGSTPPTDRGGTVHLVETVRAAVPHQAERGRVGGRIRLAPQDLRVAITEGREANLVLFCVDASGSMAARARMREVKTAVLSLLTDAYRRRDTVGLITFRRDRAELALPPTGSVEIAAARLRDLPAGGRTPLAEALIRSAEVVRVQKLRDPRRRALLVLVTDGRATSGPDALARAHRAAAALGRTGLACVVVDCESGRFRMGLAARVADLLAATYVPLGEVNAAALAAAAGRAVQRLDKGGAA